jgi:hypothetical protein
MRRAFLAALIVAALVAAGCGGSSSDSKDVDAITKSYTAYVEAVKSGDGKTACQHLTPAFQRQAAQLATPSKHAQVKGAGCAKAISEGTLRSVLRNFEPKLERVQVNGDAATGFQPGEGPLGPQKVFFRRLGGDWLIAAVVYQKGGPKIGA